MKPSKIAIGWIMNSLTKTYPKFNHNSINKASNFIHMKTLQKKGIKPLQGKNKGVKHRIMKFIMKNKHSKRLTVKSNFGIV